ncbi:MAG: DUF2064 domain-containing protein [Marinirhabdus sp.]
MNHPSTAILIFANTAQQEQEKKPFRAARTVFETLNKEAIAKVKKTGLPYFHISEEQQMGATFGQRYVNAIQFVFNKGFQNIITIGNDTPHLKTAQLLKTAQKLKENPVVLGPSVDGGYYLMGLQRSQFDPQAFLKIPWQTPRVVQGISQLFSAKKIKPLFLAALHDIDGVSDIKKLTDGFKNLSAQLLKMLRSVLSKEKTNGTYFRFFTSFFQKENHFNKGSPSSAPVLK